MPIDPLTLILGGTTILSGLFNGWAQGKISEQQLAHAAAQLGLSREQFEFYKRQVLRQNAIADANTRFVSPLVTALMGHSTGQLPRISERAAAGPPVTGNPYQRGTVGGPPPGAMPMPSGMPGPTRQGGLPGAPPAGALPMLPNMPAPGSGPPRAGEPPAGALPQPATLPTSPGELARMVALLALRGRNNGN
jgi:hypothetical protein